MTRGELGVRVLGLAVVLLGAQTALAYYSPALGRFLNRDPLEEDIGGIHLYAYVHNEPISTVDPLGGCSQRPSGMSDDTWNKLKADFENMKNSMASKCQNCCPCDADKKQCKADADKIADRVKDAWLYNYGRPGVSGGDRVGGYFCWDWSKALRDASASVNSTKWCVEEAMLEKVNPHDGYVHYYVKLTACGSTDPSCRLIIDDGFFDGSSVHEEPWPGTPNWQPKVPIVHPGPCVPGNNLPFRYTHPNINGCPKCP